MPSRPLVPTSSRPNTSLYQSAVWRGFSVEMATWRILALGIGKVSFSGMIADGMSYTVIGASTPRVDGMAKVTGAERYAANVLLPGTLWGKALRSPHPHARIARLDVSKARQLSSVLAVLTAADLPDML